jgi:hypothetical protein
MCIYPECNFGVTGGTMETMVHDSEQPEIPEQRLWRAVIASTVEEWVHGPLRKSREAEQFLFQDENDYRAVCCSAGIDPANLRQRLERIRSRKSEGNTHACFSGSACVAA